MKSLKTLIISATAVAALGAPAFAGPVGMQRTYPINSANYAAEVRDAQINQLENQRHEVAELRLKPKSVGPKQVRYMTRQSDLDDLIDRLKSGRNVSADEIDRALAE